MALLTVNETRGMTGKAGVTAARLQDLLDSTENEIAAVVGYPTSGVYTFTKRVMAPVQHLSLPKTVTAVSQVREHHTSTWEVVLASDYTLMKPMLMRVYGLWHGWYEISCTLADDSVRRRQVQWQLLELDLMDATVTEEEVGSYQAQYRNRLEERKRVLQNMQVETQWL